MATPNRAGLLIKAHKILKKQYKVETPLASRTVLEQLLFACCLEDSHYDKAEEAFAKVQEAFFDWNEVRVSSVQELAEVMHMLPKPEEAGGRLRRALQSVFESTYSFDLEAMKKMNLGQAQQKLKKLDGVSEFAVGYLTQSSLGGHAVPVDQGALEALYVVGIIDEAEKKAGTVPGAERAIPKNKGVEFGSLLHQLSADFTANPYAPNLHKLLLQINPEAKDRLPRKLTKRQLEAQAAREAAERKAQEQARAEAQAKAQAKAKAAAAAARQQAKKGAETPKKGAEAAKKPPAKPVKRQSAAASKKRPSSAGLARKKPR